MTDKIRTVAKYIPFVFLAAMLAMVAAGILGGFRQENTSFMITFCFFVICTIIMLISYIWCFVLSVLEEIRQKGTYNPWGLIGEWAILCAGFLLLSTVVNMGTYPTVYSIALGTVVTIGGKAGRYIWQKQL